MIHPSYFELMNVVNKDVQEGDEPIVTSRYSIVLGTAKRARQLVAANHTTYRGQEEKPLSIAVDELKNGEIHIIRNEETDYSDEEHIEGLEEEAAEEEFFADESGEEELFSDGEEEPETFEEETADEQ